MQQNRKTILLTIDVEDWFQVENLRPWFPPNTWDNYPLRVEQNTNRILDLFDQIQPKAIKATFFILGWIAKRVPSLVREIQQRGHEVASHGYNHMMCTKLNHNDLKQDLISSKALIEDITGKRVSGYRAPNFSINENVLSAIQHAGYKYDSSYNNFSKHGRYGLISANGHPKQGIAVTFPKGFNELPISNLNFGNQILPWGGGGYFRFTPFLVFKAGIKQILKSNDAYMFYMHPWEIDPNQPKVKESKGLSGLRHYLNLDKTYQRLSKLISSFNHHDFLTCSQYIEQLNQIISADTLQKGTII